jgi:hypothetical protein
MTINDDTPFSANADTEYTGAQDNILEKLKEAVKGKVTRPTVTIELPERPGVSLRISPNITQNQIKSWRRNCGEDSKQGLDTLKFAATVVGHSTTGILFNGEVAKDENGFDVTFASPQILEMLSAVRPIPDAVIAIFGLEPHVEAAAVAIMEAAGYGDSVETVDPTVRSSTN